VLSDLERAVLLVVKPFGFSTVITQNDDANVKYCTKPYFEPRKDSYMLINVDYVELCTCGFDPAETVREIVELCDPDSLKLIEEWAKRS